MGITALVNGAIRDRLQDNRKAPASYTDIAGGFRLMFSPDGIILFHKEHPQDRAVVGDQVWTHSVGNRWNLKPEWRSAVSELVNRLGLEEPEAEDVPF